MEAKLYGFAISHPVQAARLMLEHKGIEYVRVELLPGLHPILLRLAGFRGGTVPALKLDGRRVQTTRAISKALDEVQSEPPLFPADPERRAAVEQAERWADEVYQPMPRILYRWMAKSSRSLRTAIARRARLPAPRLIGVISWPQARFMAAKVDADDETTRATIERIPAALDHVDGLIAAGTIGGAQPNAADFAIAPTTRVLMAHASTRAAVEGRPAAEHALRLVPDYPGGAPALLPSEWLGPLREAAQSRSPSGKAPTA